MSEPYPIVESEKIKILKNLKAIIKIMLLLSHTPILEEVLIRQWLKAADADMHVQATGGYKTRVQWSQTH